MTKLDRYIFRQMLGPLGLCIALITTILIMHRMLRLMDMIINKGIPASVFFLFLAFLLPSLLVLSIPMAVLVAILMTFSRMSADNEIVALKANGISLFRMLRPPLILGILGWLVSSAIMIYVLPYANRPAKQKIMEMATKHADAQIEPRVFYDKFKDFMLYVQEKLPDDPTMHGIFVSHTNDAGDQQLMVAERGRLISDQKGDQTYLKLENGSVHELPKSHAKRYTVSSFTTQSLPLLNERTRKKLKKIPFSHREMTITELKKVIADNLKQLRAAKDAYLKAAQKKTAGKHDEENIKGLERTYRYWQWVYGSSRVELQKKFSLPFACIIFALIGVPLGIFNRRRKQGGSIGISLLLFLAYYVLLSVGQNLGDNGNLSPMLSMWLPNIVLAIFAALLLYYSAMERKPMLWLSDALFSFLARVRGRLAKLGKGIRFGSRPSGGGRPSGYWVGSGRPRFPRLLDRYVATKFMRLMAIVVCGLILIFCVVNFIEVIDDVIEHKSGVMSAFKYVALSVPQLLFWVIPMAVLVTALMTINLMSRSNELIVLLAGGTSLQRISAVILAIALLWSAGSFLLSEYIVPYTNKEAYRVKREEINRQKRKSKFAKYKIWYRGSGNRIYNIGYIDQRPREPIMKDITIFEFDKDLNIKHILQAESAYYANGKWFFENVDFKRMTPDGPRTEMMERLSLRLDETPEDFIKLKPKPDEMSYGQLDRYIEELKSAGYSYQQYRTDLMNKIAMPMIAFIIALIAVPLGVMAARSGRLVGLGAAIAIAGVFFLIHSTFISFGHSGRIPSFLAAWSANILFGATGLFLFSHART